ncbi:hypothetical protein V1477_005142 [Vespula maculifrons]|uniref:Uncharacterized protein n=1 Tax=Vespula maculifrons TaxID=7453 RepID=A0ABD2CNT1_VESMC
MRSTRMAEGRNVARRVAGGGGGSDGGGGGGGSGGPNCVLGGEVEEKRESFNPERKRKDRMYG